MAYRKKPGGRLPTGRPRVSSETEDLVYELYTTRKDWPVKKICAACQISVTTLYRIIHEREGGKEDLS